MPLFAVERDLSQVPPDRFRLDLRGLVTACERLQGLGKRVRYISSAVFPAEARGLCLFGAEELQWIREVNEVARLPYSRIFAVLDLTPAGVRRELSGGRRPPQPTAPPAAVRESHNGREYRGGDEAQNGAPAPAPVVSEELARWSDEGRRVLQILGGWLEDARRIQAHAGTVQGDRDMLAAEVRRLQEDNEGLRVQREELEQTLQTLAGQMTRTADEILYRFGRRGAPGDLAER